MTHLPPSAAARVPRVAWLESGAARARAQGHPPLSAARVQPRRVEPRRAALQRAARPLVAARVELRRAAQPLLAARAGLRAAQPLAALLLAAARVVRAAHSRARSTGA
jgi:hypothetical protein